MNILSFTTKVLHDLRSGQCPPDIQAYDCADYDSCDQCYADLVLSTVIPTEEDLLDYIETHLMVNQDTDPQTGKVQELTLEFNTAAMHYWIFTRDIGEHSSEVNLESTEESTEGEEPEEPEEPEDTETLELALRQVYLTRLDTVLHKSLPKQEGLLLILFREILLLGKLDFVGLHRKALQETLKRQELADALQTIQKAKEARQAKEQESRKIEEVNIHAPRKVNKDTSPIMSSTKRSLRDFTKKGE